MNLKIAVLHFLIGLLIVLVTERRSTYKNRTDGGEAFFIIIFWPIALLVLAIDFLLDFNK